MITISKVFNKLVLLSPELSNSDNQKMVVETNKPFDLEESTFWIHIGPEKGFDKKEQYVQLTIEEATRLWEFLGRFFSSDVRYKMKSDDDGHDFIVPVDQEKAFDKWLESVYDESLEEELPMPDRVISIGGSPTKVTFTHPIID